MKNVTEAERLFNLIGYGHQTTLKRPFNAYTDRKLREMVEDANRHADCIINVGDGYYRPVPGNATDEAEFNRYINSELSRARKILHKRMCMKKAFSERKESELLINHTG